MVYKSLLIRNNCGAQIPLSWRTSKLNNEANLSELHQKWALNIFPLGYFAFNVFALEIFTPILHRFIAFILQVNANGFANNPYEGVTCRLMMINGFDDKRLTKFKQYICRNTYMNKWTHRHTTHRHTHKPTHTNRHSQTDTPKQHIPTNLHKPIKLHYFRLTCSFH